MDKFQEFLQFLNWVLYITIALALTLIVLGLYISFG